MGGSHNARCAVLMGAMASASATAHSGCMILIGSSSVRSISSTCAPIDSKSVYRLVNQRGDFRVDAGIAQRAAVGDAPAFDAVVESFAVVDIARRRLIPVAHIGACDDVEHERGIGHVARDRALVPQRAGGRMRVHRHDAEGRLESKQSAEAGGNADRAAAIGGDVHGAHAERRGDRGAAAAAARCELGVPGIDGDAGERAVGHALPAELGRAWSCREIPRLVLSCVPPAGRLRSTADSDRWCASRAASASLR